MKTPEIEQIKKIMKNKVAEAKEECFQLANPLSLQYDQLGDSEKAIYNLCGYLDGYDQSTLERLVEIIGKMFYE